METYNNCNFLFIFFNSQLSLTFLVFLCLYMFQRSLPMLSYTFTFLALCYSVCCPPTDVDFCWTLCKLYRLLIYFFLRFSLPFFIWYKKDEKFCLHCPENMRGVKCLLPARSTSGRYTGTLSFWLRGYKMPLLELTPRTYFIFSHWNFYVFV
jgi:hypothetical protein